MMNLFVAFDKYLLTAEKIWKGNYVAEQKRL